MPTSLAGPLTDPIPPAQDVDALRAAVRDTTGIEAEPVTHYAGIRPLLMAGGKTADLSRRFAIRQISAKAFVVTGGKLGLFRVMGERTLDLLLETGLLAPGSRSLTDSTPIRHWDGRQAGFNRLHPDRENIRRWLASGMAVTAADILDRRIRLGITAPIERRAQETEVLTLLTEESSRAGEEDRTHGG